MQLDLFEDNRTGILLNIANEFIQSGELAQAVSVYEQILDDSPDDTHVSALLKLLSEWSDLLSGINKSSAIPEYLNTLWLRLESLSHPVLRSVVIDTLIEAVRSLPDPDLIYIPPRFHLGQILMAADRNAEAALCFSAAFSNGIFERSRFLAWRGDALTLAGNDDDALKNYLDAFLEDPLSIDMQSIKHIIIEDLLTSLHFDAMDEIAEAEEPAWLPVWGWLQGVFPLPTVPEAGLSTAAVYENLIVTESCSLPRIWFDLLVRAEKLRVTPAENQELVAVRRLMKKTNGFMFDLYLEKIRGRKLP